MKQTLMMMGNKINSSDLAVGRLESTESKWTTADANDYIMRVVSEGYINPFLELLPSKVMTNNKSARDNMEFVKE